MFRDFVYAVRAIRRRPLLVVATTLTLGLGIGGTTTVFSVVNAVLLRPLPFDDPDRLVRVYEVTPEGVPFAFSTPNFLDLRAESKALSDVAAFRERGPMVLADGGDPRHLVVVPSSVSLAAVLGVPPAIGRFFEGDTRGGARDTRLLVISDGIWRERFEGDPSVLGRSVRLDGEPFTIVGVMPRGFDFPRGAEAWTPLATDASVSRDDKDLSVIGRLSSGASLDSLRAELRTLATALSETHPRSNRGWSAGAVSLEDWLVAASFKDAVWIVFAAVGLLLLLACANVASLLIAQGAARQGEMRVRAALGASTSHIMRQLLTEAAVLGVLGTAAGVLVGAWSIAALQLLAGDRLPRIDQLRIDGVVLAFACVAGAISCVMFGVAPALQATRVDLRSGMDSVSRSTGQGIRLRRVLVVGEVALALVLLVSAALLVSSLVRLLRTDSGFQSNGLVAMSVEVSPARYSEERLAQFYRRLLDTVRDVPGVSAAAATSTDPFRRFGFSNSVTPEERAASSPESGFMQAGWRSITPGFFETLQVPLLSGRTFDERDTADRERVVMVNQTLARQLWPGGDPVGKRIYWGGTTGRTRTVVGVTGDFQDETLGAPVGPMLFVPHAQVDLPGMTILARTSLNAGDLTPTLRALVRELDPALPPPDVHTIDGSRSAAADGSRFSAALLGAFASIAFVLAVTGVYAMLAFIVGERRREMAIRVALGARAADIVRQLVTNGMALTTVGVVLGLMLAAVTTRALSSQLYGVGPTDPWSFAGAAVALLAAATLACYLPARRGSRVDPLVLLRD